MAAAILQILKVKNQNQVGPSIVSGYLLQTGSRFESSAQTASLVRETEPEPLDHNWVPERLKSHSVLPTGVLRPTFSWVLACSETVSGIRYPVSGWASSGEPRQAHPALLHGNRFIYFPFPALGT